MLKSLYSGVSGMKGFQTKLDVIGNNIANVNTVGFKKGRVMFQDIISQNIAGATGPNNQTGGINPKQVGLGTRISSIDTLHTPGSPMTTNVGTDLAIDGDAFFVVTSEAGANATPYLTKAGNFTVDASGNLVNSNGFFVKGTTDTGLVDIKLSSADYTSFSIDAYGYINVVDKNGQSGKLAYDGTNYYMNNDDTRAGENISLATAVVPNPGGLSKVGSTLFEETGNSGDVFAGRIEDNRGGQINSGILEMSNVDLTEEFTELIVAQRGFQANARTITTSDSILEEIINLKR
ncbi:flagellar hook-basal body complex protein [Bacillus sp. EB01]|uniref:flagellar hook-basal body complex protein n=1 Tax=Bacillus sp. EB01 TaxID=1347086 RepID=UPI0005C4FC7D|nr:flagellar hook-basal body complex protein [Bacillus sp. EB01]